MANQEFQVPGSLAGKVAIVSGASSGIGAAIARELNRRGASVAVNYRSSQEKDAATQVINTLTFAEKSVAVEADLSTVSGPQHLVETTVSKFDKVDILVNNAVNLAPGLLEDITCEQWEQVMLVNSRGTLLLTQAVLRHLAPSNSRIVNIGSSNSVEPDLDGMTLYAGSKGMIDSFTRCWARELPRKYGCTVNTIAPGPTGTEAMLSAPDYFRQFTKPAEERTPVAPRMGSPEEIANIVAMVCEEGAKWLNGARLNVSGGLKVT